MKRISGFVEVPEADREAFARELPEHTRLTLLEPGCMEFSVTPDPEIPGRYKVEECFTDDAAFALHAERAAKTPWAHAARNIKRSYSEQR